MNIGNLKKTLALYFENTNIGFVFWFLIGILITVIFYKPFEQPILFDRSYLLYMSQVVYRGEHLYSATTFGYTPLSTIFVGFFMKLGGILGFNTIESARILGLLLYGFLCASIFILSKALFNKISATLISCVLFCGLGYLQILSGINAEPKLWVLWFSVLGIYFFNKGNWFLTGLFFSLGAMSWHVSVISLFACAIMLPWNSKGFSRSFFKLCLGVFIGVLPVLFYLYITDGWMDFWNQAIVRKLVVEGELIGESPFHWIKAGVYPYFVLEPLHFLFALFGFLLGVFFLFKKKHTIPDTSIKKQTLIFLIVYSFLWGVFNSFDFQTNVDLLPLIPPIIIFSTFFLIKIFNKEYRKSTTIILFSILLLYNFFDAFIYDLSYTFSEQVSAINSLRRKHNKLFVLGYEEYYTVLEKPMPTKFMRYANYEDHMIDNEKGGCIGISEFIVQEKFDVIIELDITKRTRSKSAQHLIDLLQSDSKIKQERGACATHIIENLTSSKEIDFFKIKDQSILFKDSFYTYKYYSIFELREPFD